MSGTRLRAGRSGDPTLPSGWIDAAFVVGSALVLAAIGRLVGRGRLRWLAPGEASIEDALARPARRLLVAWFALSALLTLVLPAAALAVWGRDARVRGVLVPYVSVLIAQAAVERWATRRFFPNMSLLTGLAYTLYRLWQLRRGRAALRAPGTGDATGARPTGRLLATGSVFWAANLVFLAGTFARRGVRSRADRNG